MKKKLVPAALYLMLMLLYILHNDLWYWHDERILFSLPIGLLYHVLFCAAAALMMWLLAACAWPRTVDARETDL